MAGSKANPTETNPANEATARGEEAALVPEAGEFDFIAAQHAADATDVATQELLEHFIASNDVNLDALFDALLDVAEAGQDSPETPLSDGSEVAVDALVAESFVTIGDFGGDPTGYHSLESKILALFDAHDSGTG